MIKKIAIAVVALVIVVSAALFLWARSILSSDLVRTRVAAQMSEALGQPVTIETIGATIFPRVTMTLGGVSIGQPARIVVRDLHVGTDLRALLSRRIEHADLKLDGGRIELPLPDFTISARDPAAEASEPAVEIVSVDEVVLNGVEIVSGGRTLRGDIEVVPEGRGLTIRKATLSAEDASIEIGGAITSFDGPVGELTVKAGTLDVPALMLFVSDFAAHLPASGEAMETGAPAPARTPMAIGVGLEAERALFGSLALTSLTGRAKVGADRVLIEPIAFGVFGGGYKGSLELSLEGTPDFVLAATVDSIDMKTVAAFAGQADTITGRLAGTMQITGRATAADVLNSTRGTARVEITQGSVRGLGLVRNVVLATSMRADAAEQTRNTGESEPFSRMGGTLRITNGVAETNDFRFESNDVLLAATGTMKLDASAVNLAGRVQLSDALSAQAGRDLLRYTAENGRVTLPATVTGSAGNLQVRIDMAGVAKRAITNRATEEAKEAIKKGLDGLFGR